MARGEGMERYWDDRAADDPYFYVDNRLDYGKPDTERFWAEGERDFNTLMTLATTRIEPTDDVVEIGCGLGRLTRAMAELAATVRALDISSEMLRQAKELNPALENVSWIHGDGTSLAGIDTESADACVSHVVFQHVPDPAITLGYITEMGRILKPGGWSAFQVSTDPQVHTSSMTQSLRERVRELLGRGPAGMTNENWRGSAVSLDDLTSTAQAAGLGVAHVSGAGTQYCVVKLAKAS